MNIFTQLKQFQPSDATESSTLEQILEDWNNNGDALLQRNSPTHFTASAFILNPSLTEVLMVHHNLFHTWTWAGGHVEPGENLLEAALREAREETGAAHMYPQSSMLLSLDILSVPDHTKGGKNIPAHVHYCAAFGLIAPQKQALKNKPDENTAIAWISVDKLQDYCAEPHMLPIYEKILFRMRAISRQQQDTLQRLPAALLPWYRTNARELPWRQDNDPYHVWLSEIMLQQTRVEAVRAYYLRFVQALPTITDLANAQESRVLKLWEGLGYYSRARNLQKAAKQIVSDFGGRFPTDYAAIRALPGIGDYTAGAVSSICFDAPQPAVDGNVIRVVSRLCELYAPPEYLKKQLVPLLREIYPLGQCGDFTQSLMELGATVCIPKDTPRCGQCPAKSFCMAYARETTSELPAKAEKKPRKTQNKTVFLLTCGDAIAVLLRPKTGLLAGLWELPNVPGTLSPEESLTLAENWGVLPRNLIKAVYRTHIFTHIEWHMTCYSIDCAQQSPNFIWAKKQQLDAEITLPTAFKLFLD